MSQTDTDPEDLKEYRGTSGSEVKTADVASDDHALTSVAENSGQERIYDATLAGERFVQFYDDTAAAIREYLSNAETAGIRRAEEELKEAGFTKDEIPQNVTEMLEMAKEETGYIPTIEVEYRRKPDETRLVIDDNGIGISTEEYQVVQRVGYSTSHDEGSRLGNFGMGWMSGFQLTSVNGVFRMKTRSFLTDEAYGTAEYVANFEMLDAEPEEYGTRFEFPGFGEEAKNINIPSKVSEFADGMVVSVLYRDFDENNEETNASDDFLPTRMEDDYDDESTVLVYEDEFFKAVMSPDRPNNRRGVLTYNISMPIRRNTSEWGTDPQFDAPWEWDYRGKREDGPIVACESDESIVGLIPKEDSKYENLMDELQEKCIPLSEVPDDAIVMPDPASSRDSFKSGHDDFWRYVSQKLSQEWAEVAKVHFEGIDSWQDFTGLDQADKKALFRAYSHFGPSYGEAEASTIQETLEDKLGVTLPLNVAGKLHKSKKTVNVVRRDSNRAHTKKSCYSKKIWKVIDDAPDGVYMAKTVSQKKADIVWGLGVTDVVRLGKNDTYGGLASDWGWEKAKDLPNRNLEEKLPELDQSVIDQYENTDASDSNNTYAGTGGNGRDPTTYRMKVRWSTGSRDYFTTYNAESLKEGLNNGDTFKAGYSTMQYLVIRPNDESAKTVAGHADKKRQVAATRLPQYVYDYLVGADNTYESYDELVEENTGATITVGDSDMELEDIPEDHFLIIAGGKIKDRFEDRPEELAELYGYDADEWNEFYYIDGDELNDTWGAKTEAKVVKTSEASGCDDFDNYAYKNDTFEQLYREDKLSGFDKDSDEYKLLFGKRYGKPSGEDLEKLIDIAADAGLGDE